MRSPTRKMAALVLALLLTGSPGPGQQPSRKTSNARRAAVGLSSIEEMLAVALKYNPDIRVAEVKLRDDEADLNRTRLRVMQKIIALHHALQSQSAAVESARAKVDRLTNLVNRGALQPTTLREAEKELAQARAKLAEARAELPYLLGTPAESLGEEVIRNEVQIGRRRTNVLVNRAMAAKIHKALETPITVNYDATPLGDVLKDLQGKVKGIAFQENMALKDLDRVKISLHLGEVQFGAALLALQDTIPGLRVIVRDYGILFTWEHQVPLGAVRLYDFWKEKDGVKDEG